MVFQVLLYFWALPDDANELKFHRDREPMFSCVLWSIGNATQVIVEIIHILQLGTEQTKIFKNHCKIKSNFCFFFEVKYKSSFKIIK